MTQKAYGKDEDAKHDEKTALEELMEARAQRDAEKAAKADEEYQEFLDETLGTESESDDEKERSKEEPKKETKEDDARSSEESGGETEQSGETDGDEKPLTVEERLNLMEEELKLKDLQRERTEIEVKKWQSLADTRKGELDYLLKSGDRPREDDKSSTVGNQLDLLSEVDDTEEKRPARRQRNLSEFEQDAIEKARMDSLRQFAVDFPDVMVDDEKTAGSYEVVFDGADVSSGVYFYRLQAGDFTDTRKMMLVK